MTFNKVVFDIETTLTADKIWCIVCKHDNTFYQFKEDNLHRFEEFIKQTEEVIGHNIIGCLLYTSPSPRDLSTSRMPSSA